MSVGAGVVAAGGAVGLTGGVVVDGAGVADAAPGSAELGAGVWLGGDCIGPEVPPVPVGVGTSGALVSSIGCGVVGGVVVGVGAPGGVPSGGTG